jgi:hypothetical protein
VALCRLEAKIISRSGGRSAVGAASYRTGKCATSAAAYRAGAELKDERTGAVYNYTRKRGVMGAEILLPEDAPEWMRDRGQLWNAVEKAEKRADAQLARDYILTLPHELDAEQRRDLTREFVRRQFVEKGFVADIAWHAPHGKGDERNHHAHVMVVMRRVDGEGFARTKERAPAGKHPAEHWKNELRAWREAWANTGADVLAAAGHELEAVRFRAGHLTLDKQREAAIARGDHAWAETLDREAEPKQGPLATKIEREGRTSHAGDDRRDVQARNAERAALRDEHAQVTAQIIDLEQERQKRQGNPAMSDVDRDRLPSTEEAQARQEAMQVERDPAPAPETRPPELDPVEASLHQAPAAMLARGLGPDEPAITVQREQPAPAPSVEHGVEYPAGGSVLTDALELLSETIHEAGYVVGEVAKEARFIVDEMAGPQPLGSFVDQELERRGDEPAPRQISPEEYRNDSAARTEYYAQHAATQVRDDALDRMQGDVAAGRSLKPDDVRALNRQDLEGIRDNGEDHFAELIGSREREQSREHERER